MKKRLKLQAALLAAFANSTYATDTCLPEDVGSKSPLEVFQCFEAKLNRQQEQIQVQQAEIQTQQAEIQTLKMRLSLTEGLVAYYPFDGNANDASGFGNHGTVKGATLTADRFGNAKSAYQFDGAKARIVVSSNPSLNPSNQLTLAFWVKINRLSDTHTWTLIIHKGNASNCCDNREYTLWLNNKPYFHFSLAGDSQDSHSLNHYGVQLGEWIFYTAVIDRRNHMMKNYINGELKTQQKDPSSSFKNGDDALKFGGNSQQKSWFSSLDGVLDEIRIYNRALTDSEIQSLYKQR
jgi:hypothetical protein